MFFFTDAGFAFIRPIVAEDGCSRLSLSMDHDYMRSCIDIPDLWAALQVAPEEALSCLCLATHAVAQLSDRGSSELPWIQDVPNDCPVTVRLYNHSSAITPFGNIKSNCIGRMVSIRGTVVRASGIKPLPVTLSLYCLKCGGTFSHALYDGMYTNPMICGASARCKAQKFKPVMQHSKCKDWQRVRLQENQTGRASTEEGRIPRTIESELSGGLVDACKAGDTVTVLGIVKVRLCIGLIS